MHWKRLCLHYRRRWWCIAALLGLSVALAGCASFDFLTEMTEQRFATAHDCGKCHRALYEEWAGSDHALAWSNPHVGAATGDYTFTECLGCHAPEPILTEQTPTARSGLHHDGVTCVSCHLQEGALVGPHTPTGKVKPHPIRIDAARITDSRLCGRCHEDTYREWDQAVLERKKTCQQCHMPLLKRTVTQSTGGMSRLIVAMEAPVSVHSHVFAVNTNEALQRMVAITVRSMNTEAALTLQNNLPHNLPTGTFGFRVLTVEVTAVDARDRQSPVIKKELLQELDTAVAPGAQVTWPLNLPADSVALQVRLVHSGYADQPVLILYEQRIPL